MTAEEKAKVGPGCVLMSSALGAGGGGCGLDQRRMSAFLGECVEPSSLRGSRLGRQASSGSVCVHVPSRPTPPGGRHLPCRRNRCCGCVFSVALWFFHCAVNVVEGIFNVFTSKSVRFTCRFFPMETFPQQVGSCSIVFFL